MKYIRMAQLATSGGRGKETREGLLPVSPSTIWRKVRDRTFPAPINLSARTSAWLMSDIEQWLCEQSKNSTYK